MKIKQLFFVAWVTLLAPITYGQTEIEKQPLLESKHLNEFAAVSMGTVDFADVNNDNYPDLLITGQAEDRMAKLYLNNGVGEFVESMNTPFEGVYLSSVAFADIDNDEDKDVLITGMNAANNGIAKLYLNDGYGVYTEMINPFDQVFSSAVAFADIDNDNDEDVLITGYSNGYVAKLYLNDGFGDFTEFSGTSFEGVKSSSVAFFDFDNDNDFDVVITGESANARIAKLYQNDGAGSFAEVMDTPFEGVRQGSVAVADIDNDNDMDLLISGKISDLYDTPTAFLYRNDGNGLFTKINESFKGVYTSSIAFCDFDNDNDQDVLVTGDATYPGFNSVIKLYCNNGYGNYTEIDGIPFEAVRESAISFADVDNDGYQDLLISGITTYPNQVTILYYNVNEIVNNIIPNAVFERKPLITTLFPNPTNGNIDIDFGEIVTGTYINIRNLNGELIEQKNIANQRDVRLHLSGENGIYFLEIVSEYSRITYKVLKK